MQNRENAACKWRKCCMQTDANRENAGQSCMQKAGQLASLQKAGQLDSLHKAGQLTTAKGRTVG
jgi:hypothetical protein